MKPSVFTPQARVLCGDCDPVALTCVFIEPETYPSGTCDGCGAPIMVGRPDVAVCLAARDALREAGFSADLWQTGGMCVATGVNLQPEGRHVMVTDRSDWDGEPGFLVGIYEGDEDEEGTCSEVEDVAGVVRAVKEA